MTDAFTKQDFDSFVEQAINRPAREKQNRELIRYKGIIQGEHTYVMEVSPLVEVIIRSSVRVDNQASGTGKNSIRCWLAAPGTDGASPMGSKVSDYITRRPGWQERVVEDLRKLYTMGRKLKNPNQVYLIKKDGTHWIKEGAVWTQVLDKPIK